MKIRFLFLCLFASTYIFAQLEIKGTVYNEKGPLEGAAVYLNNTMLGTTTNKNGTFSLPVKEGVYDLIISFLGYKTINYQLNTALYKQPLTFALEEDNEMLDEIVIEKTVYDDAWRYNLQAFKNEFLGTTEFAKHCEILNEEVLSFDFNAKENILIAYARKPLEIKHKKLGYLIKFDLESFERNKNRVTYLGYTRYAQLKGGKRKQNRWKKNRLKAYHGSPVHFYKSLIANRLEKDGFIVNQFQRKANPNRPSDEEIKKARQLLRLNGGIRVIDLSNKKPENYTAIDSAWAIANKTRLPKYKDYLYKSKLKENEILSKDGLGYKFIFSYNLSVVYTREKEELEYVKRTPFSRAREPMAQTSSIIPLKTNIKIDFKGNLINPLAVFYEGYWSYEKFAHSLPLDYEVRE